MAIRKSKQLTIFRVFGIFLLGLISGIQVALYMYDYYDDGIADYRSLLIGVAMIFLSIAFILYTFRRSDLKN